jgi:hypothetical protein
MIYACKVFPPSCQQETTVLVLRLHFIRVVGGSHDLRVPSYLIAERISNEKTKIRIHPLSLENRVKKKHHTFRVGIRLASPDTLHFSVIPLLQ